MEDNNSTVVCFEKKGNYQDISLDYNSTHGGNDNPDKTFKKAFNNVFNIPEQNLEDDNNTGAEKKSSTKKSTKSAKKLDDTNFVDVPDDENGELPFV